MPWAASNNILMKLLTLNIVEEAAPEGDCLNGHSRDLYGDHLPAQRFMVSVTGHSVWLKRNYAHVAGSKREAFNNL